MTLCLLLCLLTLTAPARGQLLKGGWIKKTQAKIDKFRKTDVRIIVLGRDDEPVQGATVRIDQVRRDFPVGLVLGEQGLPEKKTWHKPVWRCFNAISLDRLTRWPRLEPKPTNGKKAGTVEGAENVERAKARLEKLGQLVAKARQRGLRVRWGGVVSADGGRNPDWLVKLQGKSLADAIDGHVADVIRRFRGQIDAYDLYTDRLDHHFLETRLGTPLVRRLFDRAGAIDPKAAMAIRFDNALTPSGANQLMQAVTNLRQSFIAVDEVAIDQRVGGILLQGPLSGVFDRIGGLKLGLVISSLEVGGASASSSAVNMETFLRTAFADPHVRGIYFAGVRADQLVNPAAALLDKNDKPTEAGKTLDHLFHHLWRTHQTHKTDELGNVRARVFAGVQRIHATLPGGEQLQTTVYLPRRASNDGPRIIVLKPLKQ